MRHSRDVVGFWVCVNPVSSQPLCPFARSRLSVHGFLSRLLQPCPNQRGWSECVVFRRLYAQTSHAVSGFCRLCAMGSQTAIATGVASLSRATTNHYFRLTVPIRGFGRRNGLGVTYVENPAPIGAN